MKTIMGMRSSQKEMRDLSVSWFAITIAFALVLAPEKTVPTLIKFGVISAFAVATGFLLHELAHKLVAQRYGCWAEYRSNDMMLVLAVLFSLTGFLFAAPGAVMIIGHVKREENGIISFAGPLVNIILGAMLLPVSLFGIGIISEAAHYGFYINTWLGLFNMIPFFVFDGAKIWRWSKKAYFSLALIGIALLIIGQSF